MNMLILSLHIGIALVMTLTMAAVLVAAQRQRSTAAYWAMISSFAGTVASGIGLLFVSAGGLGRFCAMMSAYTLLVIATRYYYQKRVVQTSL